MCNCKRRLKRHFMLPSEVFLTTLISTPAWNTAKRPCSYAFNNWNKTDGVPQFHDYIYVDYAQMLQTQYYGVVRLVVENRI